MFGNLVHTSKKTDENQENIFHAGNQEGPGRTRKEPETKEGPGRTRKEPKTKEGPGRTRKDQEGPETKKYL